MGKVKNRKKINKTKEYKGIQDLREALRKSEERYHLVAENALVGIYQLNKTGHFLFVNKAFAKMVGRQPKELLGQHFSVVLPSFKIERGKEVFQELLLNDKSKKREKYGPHRVRESYLHHKKGHDLFVQYSFNFPLKNEEDAFDIALTGMAVDITEEKKLENELMARTKTLENLKTIIEHEKVQVEAILNSIGDGVIATDTYGRIIMMNKKAEKMLGWTSDELFGRPLIDSLPLLTGEESILLPKENHPINMALATSRNITTYTTDQPYFYVSKNGRKFPVTITASPVRLNKTIIGAIETFRDVTKSQEIDKAKGEFVSLASHQLRTPLTIIGLYSEMLAGQDGARLPEQQEKYLQEIMLANQRMIKLVDMILNVSRIDLGVLNVVSMPVNFKEMAEIICRQHLPLIKEKELQCEQNYGRDLPIFKSDPKLVEIILDNLISNAVKYTPAKGRIVLSIQEKRSNKSEEVLSSAEQSGVLIKVADTGYGIPAVQQDKVFSKMFRADNVVLNDTEGTGLGLYIVKSMVEKMGGKIWFESEENKGTTFYVFLPSVPVKTKPREKAVYQQKLI